METLAIFLLPIASMALTLAFCTWQYLLTRDNDRPRVRATRPTVHSE